MINNRTRQYIVPIINSFGDTFLRELGEVNNSRGIPGQTIHSTGILDVPYYRCKGFTKELFLVFDIQGIYDPRKGKYVNPQDGKRRFFNFLSYIRTNKNYVSDYQFEYRKKHCIVFQVPEKFKESYEHFLKGRYSLMYSKKELNELGIKPFLQAGKQERPSKSFIVLTKDPELGKDVLKKSIQVAYGVDGVPENPTEFDILWGSDEEILNYESATEEEISFFRSIKC